MHHFQDMAHYYSIFFAVDRVILFNALDVGESLNSELRNLASKTEIPFYRRAWKVFRHLVPFRRDSRV